MNLETIFFRPAVPSDIPTLQILYKQFLPAVDTNAEEMAVALARIRQQPDNQVIVAELAGEVVATCQVCIYDNLVRAPKRKAVIDSVGVSESCRGRGIASAMIQWVVQTLTERGCSHIGVASRFSRQVAHHLYPKMGFDLFGYYYLFRT